MKRIVHSTTDGHVTITNPSPRLLKAFTNGGGLEIDRKLRDRHIANDVRVGVPEPVAVRWCQAKAEGGLTEALAFELIRDRDCRRGADHVVEKAVERDRFFRNAWRRPKGGGPIHVDLTAARPVIVQNAQRTIEVRLPALEQRALDLLMAGDDAAELALRQQISALRSFDLRAFAITVRDAAVESAEELRALWPAELAR